MSQTTPKVLYWDIESSLITGKTWKIWETNVLDIVEDWYLMAYSYRWGHEKTTHVKTLPDYKGYKTGSDCEEQLVKDLWKLLDEATIIIGHNCTTFDYKKARAKFIEYGLKPHSPVQIIDTLKIARKEFGFTSNKLNDLGELLGVGKKTPHTGLRLWLECMDGDEKAWSLMKKYAKQDTVLLYEIYQKLAPWRTTGANMGMLIDDGKKACPCCGSEHVTKRGFSTTSGGKYQRFHCQNCGKYSRSRNKEKGTGNPLTH